MKSGVICTLITAYLVAGIGISAHSTKPQIPHAVKHTFEPTVPPSGPGPISLELRFYMSGEYPCSTITVLIEDARNFEYKGDTLWIVPVYGNEEHFLVLDGVIAPFDTSGIALRFECRGFRDYARWFAVTTSDTLEIYHGDPRGTFNFPEPTHRGGPRLGRVIPGEFPLYDSLYGYGDTLTDWHDIIRHGKSTRPAPEPVSIIKPAMTMEKLRELERTPLEGKQTEMHKIGDTLYVRHQGEFKFEARGSFRNRLAHAKEVGESLASQRVDQFPAKFAIDLRDPKDAELVRQVVDSLNPTKQEGIFEATLDESTYRRLEQNGIRLRVVRKSHHEGETNSAEQ